MAAEVLGVPLTDVVIYSSDTDMTPFDTGAYASSTTYISGTAVKRAAEKIADQIRERAALMLELDEWHDIRLENRMAIAPDGRSVSMQRIALHSLHQHDQRQLMATASYVSSASPPPFAGQFAEVEVDTETGQVTVTKLVMAVDAGMPGHLADHRGGLRTDGHERRVDADEAGPPRSFWNERSETS